MPHPEVQRSRFAPRWSVSRFLMIILVLSYVGQQVVIVHMGKPYDAYLALSGYGMKSWHLWELFTYQFFHLGWIHLVLNLAGLGLIASPLETEIGAKRFLKLYLGAVLVGGILQGATALAGFLLPESQETIAAFLRDRFGGPVYGSSVGLCGVFAAICFSNSGRRIFGTPIQAGMTFWLAFALAVKFVIFPTDPAVAQLAHLGGLIFGALFGRSMRTSATRS